MTEVLVPERAKKLDSSAKASAAQLKLATKQVEKFGNGLKISGGHIANLTTQLTAGDRYQITNSKKHPMLGLKLPVPTL